MKLVKTTTLAFTDAKSDKVYEVDLCKSGDGYLVNFRYGRRGKHLKEGTKTTKPLPKEKAEALFDKLVASKTKKGYKPIGPPKKEAPEIALPDLSATESVGDPREKAILWHLATELENPEHPRRQNWKISRVIWRAGELRIKAALPYILRLRGKAGDAMREFACVWAMGRCGVTAEQAPLLEHYAEAAQPGNIRRLAVAMLLRVLPSQKRQRWEHKLLAGLPPALSAKLEEGDLEGLKEVLWNMLFQQKKKKYDFLTDLYLLSLRRRELRGVLLEAFSEIPFAPPYFKAVRSVFKLSEQLDDGQFWGLFAYRFEAGPAFFTSSYYVWLPHLALRVKDSQQELQKDNPKLAYSNKTRKYFKRRVSRSLARIAAAGDHRAYVSLATGLLLRYSPEDEESPYTETRWVFDNEIRRYKKVDVRRGALSSKNLLNEILYANSPRYVWDSVVGGWAFAPGYSAGMSAPEVREEAFPELWDKTPKAYLHLLAESELPAVLEFALRALKAHPALPELKKRMDVPFLKRVLSKRAAGVASWALEVVREKHDPEKPDLEMAILLLSHSLEEARALVQSWMKAQPAAYLSDHNLLVAVLMHSEADMKKWVGEVVPGFLAGLGEARREAVVVHVVAMILGCSKGEGRKAAHLAKVLRRFFPRHLSRIGFSVIEDLAGSPLEENRLFAASLLRGHSSPVEAVPYELFRSFIRSKHQPLRECGIHLLGRMPEGLLLAHSKDLLHYAYSKHGDLRRAAAPVIGRLVAQDGDFAAECIEALSSALLRKESREGVHAELLQLLQNGLGAHLDKIGRKKTFRLLNSNHRAAQELGTLLVDKYVAAESLSLANIIRLGEHEVRACREICWRMFRENVARIRYEREDAIRILDATWDDTRAFAFDFFRNHFRQEDWTPQILISICDSVREDVQAFGRELINRFFEEEHGGEYLLKLSQHPKPAMQLMATAYLEDYAAGDVEKIKNLSFFFITVLSQVNKGRVAKDRLLDFLRKQALENREVAGLVLDLLERLSLTQAVGDKAASIEIMRDIHEKYPDLPSIIHVKTA